MSSVLPVQLNSAVGLQPWESGQRSHLIEKKKNQQEPFSLLSFDIYVVLQKISNMVIIEALLDGNTMLTILLNCV